MRLQPNDESDSPCAGGEHVAVGGFVDETGAVQAKDVVDDVRLFYLASQVLNRPRIWADLQSWRNLYRVALL